MKKPPGWLSYMVVIAWCAILAGVVLRFSQLPTRVLFVDEAITQIRVAGHTYAEMNAVYDGRQRTALSLRRNAQVDGRSSVDRLVASLVKEDTQHPPFFYILELEAVRVFGDGLFAWRLLPALFGVLSIAAAYILGRELFADRRVGLLAAALLAVSPIERLYSMQAREYSLLTLFVLLSTAAAVRAVRTNAPRWWAAYAVLAAAGLYASPLMGYVVLAHGVFTAGATVRTGWSAVLRFAAAAATALTAYLPWLYQLAVHRKDIVAENEWSSTVWPITRLAAKWIFNTGATFFDLEYLNLRWAIVLGAVTVVVAIAIWRGFRDADLTARWCLAAGIVVPALILILPDLVLGQHRSAVARYGLPIFALLPIIVARGLFGRPIFATIVLAGGLFACAVGSTHASWWDNDSNGDDAQIAAAIGRDRKAQVVSSIAPPDFIPFARLLHDDVRVSLSPHPAAAEFSVGGALFVLDPSAGDLRSLQKRTAFAFVAVQYPHTTTAHDIGARIDNAGKGDAVGGAGSALYEAVRGAPLAGRLL